MGGADVEVPNCEICHKPMDQIPADKLTIEDRSRPFGIHDAAIPALVKRWADEDKPWLIGSHDVAEAHGLDTLEVRQRAEAMEIHFHHYSTNQMARIWHALAWIAINGESAMEDVYPGMGGAATGVKKATKTRIPKPALLKDVEALDALEESLDGLDVDVDLKVAGDKIAEAVKEAVERGALTGDGGLEESFPGFDEMPDTVEIEFCEKHSWKYRKGGSCPKCVREGRLADADGTEPPPVGRKTPGLASEGDLYAKMAEMGKSRGSSAASVTPDDIATITQRVVEDTEDSLSRLYGRERKRRR